MWSVPFTVPLNSLVTTAPFCSGLTEIGSGLRNRSEIFAEGSGLLKRSGTFTGARTLGGEGLRILVADCGEGSGDGVLALNRPLPGSRAGTDLARLGNPSFSDYTHKQERHDMRQWTIYLNHALIKNVYIIFHSKL